MSLVKYKSKRSFGKTPEPAGKVVKGSKNRFVVQEHHASHLHYDFRLEMDGVLKSWAVPKGPSLDPTIKRLAMMVEDHPVEYQHFSGKIPEGNYGAGEVRIWDKGTYEMIGEGDGIHQIKAGKLTFIMKGKKLKGEFHMVHTHGYGSENSWLLFKHVDEYAKPGWEIDQLLPYGSNKERKELEEQSSMEKLLGKKKPAPKRAVGTTRRATKSAKSAVKATSARKPAKTKAPTKKKKSA